MRPVFEALRACVVASAFTSTLVSCGGGAEIALQLHPGVDATTGDPFDTSALKSLHILVRDASGGIIERRILLDREHSVDVDPIEVDTARSVTVEVWGCEDPAQCERADVVFRGCEHVDTSGGGTVDVDMDMFPIEDRAGSCQQQ